MSERDDAMCYVASWPGTPGYSCVILDLPDYARETGKELGQLIVDGASVSRVSIEDAIRGLSECAARDIGN